MTKYPVVVLGEVLTPAKDVVTVDEDAQYETAGLYSYARGLFRRPVIFGSETNYRQYNRLRSGQIVYSKLFGWEGAVAYVPDEFDGVHVSHEFPTFEFDSTKLDPGYVRHYVTWPSFHAALSKEASGMGSRRQRVKPERFLSSQIPLPDLIEQRRIADKLDATMGSIARAVQLKKESDALVQQHADSLLRPVDRVATLSSALRVDQDFVDVSSDEKYAVTGIYSFGKGLIKRPVIQGSETAYPRFARLRKGQVVMSKLNAWEGALAVVDESFSGTYVSPEYPVFSLNTETADPEYIGHLLAWPELWSRLTPRGSMVRRKRTTPTTLLSTEVPLPPLEEQRRIAERLTLARRVAEAGAQQVADLEVLRKGLLDAAFSGHL
ncbi:restriction endonuclease subunit S [Streptomyces sp. b94]|uniref:restriction endonuclease subunit S n=1 Tax=Streptomyces sp. b94 TaxID=1827634 RepID=UPI001B39A40B|nr:restriction endonuclease subunit S [Streptomyces sp. b94]MBQ1100728.1 restriction endonuclease subunit S [Streptomyces sp. b94]